MQLFLPFSRVPPVSLTGSWRSHPPGLIRSSWQRWRWERRRCPPLLLGTACSASGRRTWSESLRHCCNRPPSTVGCRWHRNRRVMKIRLVVKFKTMVLTLRLTRSSASWFLRSSCLGACCSPTLTEARSHRTDCSCGNRRESGRQERKWEFKDINSRMR